MDEVVVRQMTDEEYIAYRWKENSLLSVDDLLAIKYNRGTYTSPPGSVTALMSERRGIHTGSVRRYLDPKREDEAKAARKAERDTAREARRQAVR